MKRSSYVSVGAGLLVAAAVLSGTILQDKQAVVVKASAQPSQGAPSMPITAQVQNEEHNGSYGWGPVRTTDW